MARERKEAGATDGPEMLETIRADAFSPGGADDVDALVAAHRRTALRLLREGQAHKGFAELVKASRTVPMTPRLASTLVLVSLQAGTEPACITLLTAGIEDTEAAIRVAIRRQLARLLRRVGAVDRAREEMIYLLAEKPGDRRGRRALNTLLLQEERWEELDASLEKEVKEALRRSAIRPAARASLQRARLWSERLKNDGRAALRYAQAAQYFDQLQAQDTAFNLRLLWLRALRESAAPAAGMQDAVQQLLASGEKVGKAQRARAVIQEMGLAAGPGASATAALAPLPVPARRAIQAELLAAAEEADAQGRRPESAALLAAALNEVPEPALEQKLEAHHVARGAWRELAQFYRDRAGRISEPRRKVEILTRLAEVLEDELRDPTSASRAYGQIVELTGDKHALQEQVRLLSMVESVSGVRKVLDEAVDRAPDDQAKVIALVARGDVRAHRRELEAARADYEAAVRLAPSHLVAQMGLAEVKLQLGAPPPVAALRAALGGVPKRSAGRLDLLRRLGRLAEAQASDPAAASWAWSEVISEAPADPEAQRRLAALARRTGNAALLEQALRAQLGREPRGTRARAARLELAALLERTGRAEEAMGELRAAVRAEPAHLEAWLLLAERMIQREQLSEAAWALEQAATATADGLERMRLWERLATFCRDRLNDPARAATFAGRAEKLRMQEAPTGPGAPPDSRGRVPLASDPGQAPTPTSPLRQSWPTEEEGVPLREAPPTPKEPMPAAPDDPSEITTGRVSVGPLGPDGEPLRTPTEEMAAAGPPDSVLVQGPALAGAAGASGERERLFEHVRAHPLDPEGYRAMATFFGRLGDPYRSELMIEIARALSGDVTEGAVPAPRLILSATDRAGLRHPILRNEQGELFSVVGYAFCRIFPTKGRAAGSRDEFSPESGPGALATADSLLASVRILGLRAPELFLSEDNGPPFSLVFPRLPRILIGQMAVRSRIAPPELRFFAGRALFTQNPDLLALRSLGEEQLDQGLEALETALHGGKTMRAEARALRETVPMKLVPRLRELYERNAQQLDLQRLAEGARHSANRAGLVVCGAVGPAILALRAKKALESEVVELVRFAASERYLEMRTRKLGGGPRPAGAV